jgi:FolB domain-containing protein
MEITTVRITDLLLRAVIGGNEWEQRTQQDIVINVTYSYDARAALQSDDMADAVNYKLIKKHIIETVETSHYHLIESLTKAILSIVMDDIRVLSATVRIDKPGALRFAQSVSTEMSSRREL